MSSRTENSIRNIFWGTVNRIVSILFPFIVRTIFIEQLGEDYLGLNTLFKSILQVLNLADLGFSSAIVAGMYKPIVQNDSEKISVLMNLYRRIYRKIGFTIGGIGLILTPFIDIFIEGDLPEGINIYFLWLLYLLNTVESYWLFAYKEAVLNAHQRNDITEKVRALCRIAISLFQIYVVMCWKNVYLYVVGYIIYSAMYNLWNAAKCKRYYPEYSCKGELDKDSKKVIYKNVGALALQKFGNTISNSLDSVIISAFLGLSMVGIYGNYNYIISSASIFTTMLYGAVTAGIGNSLVTETLEKNYKDLKIFFFLNTWLIGWCCICFMCVFRDFMMVWMGESMLFPNIVVLTLVLRFFFEQIRKVILTYKDAAGMWWIDKWRPLVGGAVNLLLNIIAVQYIGVAGVALSTIFSYVLIEMPWETHAFFKQYFKKSEREYYDQMFKCIFALGVAGLFTFFVCERLPFGGIGGIVVKLLICLLLPNVIFIGLNLKNVNFKYSIHFINSFFALIRAKIRRLGEREN